MATVATLTIDLIANSGRLNRDLKKANKNTKGWADTTRRQVNVAGKAFGVMGATGVAALGAIYAQSAKSGDALAKLSDQLGEMPERVTRLQHAAELTTTGGTEMLNKSLETMNKRLGEARQGTGEAAKYLEQLGLANESFFALSPADKVGELADRFATLNDNEERAAAAAAIFGRSGGEMVNVLAAGKDGLKAMADEADALGITMDRVKLAKIEAANDSFHRATQTTKSFGNSLANEVAPFVGAISEEFANAAIEAGGFGQVATNVVTATAEGVGFAADAVHGLNAVWKAGHVAVSEYVSFALNNWAAMDRGITAFLDKIPGVEARESEFLQGMAESMAIEAEAVLAEFNGIAMSKMPSEKIKEWIEDYRAKAEVAAKEVAANRELNVLGNVTGGGDDPASTAQETERIISAQRDRFSRIHEEMLLAEDKVVELEAYRKQRADLELTQDLERIRAKGLLTKEIEDEFRVAREQAEKIHAGRIEGLEKTSQQSRMGMATDFFGNLAQVASTANGKQSRLAKNAAIAQTVINTYQSATSAYSAMASIPYVGPVLGAAAAAAAISAGMANVSAIRGQSTPSYDGGGYTGAGARAGGLDGKGGFMAMLHPRETVVDHTKGQSLGGSMVQLSLTIINELGVAANADIEQDGDQVRLFLRQVKEELDNDIQNLSGIGRTMKEKFNLSVAGAY